jgi:hypothetical protein
MEVIDALEQARRQQRCLDAASRLPIEQRTVFYLISPGFRLFRQRLATLVGIFAYYAH